MLLTGVVERVAASIIGECAFRSEAGEMDKADIYGIYELGNAINPLKTMKQGVKAVDAFSAIISSRNALAQLLGDNPPAKIDLCRPDVQRLYNAVEKAFTQHFWDAENGRMKFPEDREALLSPYSAWEIENALQSFEPVFRAEMQVAAAFWVPRKGTYNTTELVNHADGCFPKDLLEIIGEMGLNEYRAAGKCFAFGLNSAAGYHACRAVEAVLRRYYEHFVGQPTGDSMQWGNMLKDLEGIKESKAPLAKTMGYIRQVKDHDRNPLSHTRVVLDEQDADILLKYASIVILAMAREMRPPIAGALSDVVALLMASEAAADSSAR